MGWIKGDMLPERLQRGVLNSFVHRCTVENFAARPSVEQMMKRGGYRLTPCRDAEWLAAHCFFVTKSGELSERHKHCKPISLMEI